tara:strand:+ start:6145 stop:8037 length:1893 start_codon:yes stop_codon:yes gene_type:complete
MYSSHTKYKKINEFNTKIILVDTYTDLNHIKKKFQNDDFTIITFDYESHQKLLNKKIIHEISDNYITDSQCKSLQNYVYKFASWFRENDFSYLLEYRKINLGGLYEDELINYFVRFLKKFKEIEIIFNNNSDKQFFAQNELFNIINYFTPLADNLQKSKINPELLTPEKIRITLSLFGYKKNLFLSKNFYLKLKNLQDILANNLFKPKCFDNKKTNILFVEYNTERFKDLFLKSKDFDAQIFYYGPKRPPFWNFSTLRTIINSKCRVITNRFLQESNKSKISNFDQTISNMNKLWGKNSLLEDFFTFENYSIFKLIKPKLTELTQNRLSFILDEIELVNHMLEKFHFDYTVVINESGFYEKIISSLSNTHKIKCIHMQEGFHWDTDDSIKNISSQGVFLQDAKKLTVWGDIDRNLAVNKAKILSSQIEIIGSPRYDDLFHSKLKNSDYILLASSGDPQPEEIEGLRTNKIEKYLDDVFKISKIVSDMNERLLIKLHPSSTQLMNIFELAPKINKKINVIPNGEIIPLLSSAKLLICIGLSSVLIEALILKKPVLFIPGMDYNWGNPSIVTEHGCFISDIDNLKNEIDKILNDKKYLQNQQNLSQNYLSQLISFQGNASQKFYEYLNNDGF